MHVSDEWTEESHEDVWAYGTCPKTAPKEVAAQLLQTAWQGQYGSNDRPWFMVTSEGLLTEAEIADIAREVWPQR